jgi:hypothetical protein
MGKIWPFFTRDVQGGLKSRAVVDSYTSKPYPFESASTYIPPDSSAKKSECDIPRQHAGLWNSIALRFGGFQAHIKALAEPLNCNLNPVLVRNYFHNRLGEIADLASKNPLAAHRIIASKLDRTPPIWKHLVLVACGDGNSLASAMNSIEDRAFSDDRALADCIVEVAKLKPKEGGLLARHAVSHIDTSAQVHMLESIVESEASGLTRLVGDLFVKIMERSTVIEREKEIYPGIRRIVSASPARKSTYRGFLAALFHGWLSECPQQEVATSYLKRT